MAKGGIVWRNRDLNNLKTEIQKSTKGREVEVERILDDLGRQAADRMQQLIATSPSGIVEGKGDRIQTGTMHDAVDSDPVTKVGNYRGVKFGWTNEQLDYFLAQEYGTGDGISRNWNNIVPMHALLQVFLETREELRAELNRSFS